MLSVYIMIILMNRTQKEDHAKYLFIDFKLASFDNNIQ